MSDVGTEVQEGIPDPASVTQEFIRADVVKQEVHESDERRSALKRKFTVVTGESTLVFVLTCLYDAHSLIMQVRILSRGYVLFLQESLNRS